MVFAKGVSKDCMVMMDMTKVRFVVERESRGLKYSDWQSLLLQNLLRLKLIVALKVTHVHPPLVQSSHFLCCLHIVEE